jgi:hypothetical protein
MRIFLTKTLARFVRREEISDQALREAIERAERGLVDADLGDGLIKQRVARKGKGSSGGYRTLIGYRRGERAVFVFGFAKKDQENVDASALKSVRAVAVSWMNADMSRIAIGLLQGEIQEVPYDA